MTAPDPLSGFLDRLSAAGLHVEAQQAPGLAPARLVIVPAADWGRLGREAKVAAWRWAAG